MSLEYQVLAYLLKIRARQTSQAPDAVNQPRITLNKRRLFNQSRRVKRG